MVLKVRETVTGGALVGLQASGVVEWGAGAGLGVGGRGGGDLRELLRSLATVMFVAILFLLP